MTKESVVLAMIMHDPSPLAKIIQFSMIHGEAGVPDPCVIPLDVVKLVFDVILIGSWTIKDPVQRRVDCSNDVASAGYESSSP